MIVQPDFLDHWKTVLLCDLLDDPCAPTYVIRLWAHCQNRKTSRFARTCDGLLKAICKATPHDADKFEAAMQEVGFIEIKDDHIVIHDWDAVNASLIASWNNGGKGGRRPKKNPEKTHGLSVGVPNKTQTEPIREEKMRLEKIGECGASDEAPPPAPNSKFIAPTKKQVAEHIWNTAKAKKLEIAEDKTESMAEQIFCHYENADWRLSGGKGGKMKDWKLAVTKWIMGDVEDGKIKRARA